MHAKRLWSALVPMCRIIWHIHIPKTAGSSVGHVLMNASGYVQFGHKGGLSSAPWAFYFSHGNKRDWIGADLLNRTMRSPTEKVLVTQETGIDDLEKNQYSLFDKTCFFSTLREPHEWVLSAANHMKKEINSTYGYFDQSNIQSRMVGFNVPLRRLPLVTCVTTVDMVDSILAAFSDARLPHDNARSHPIVSTPELVALVQHKYAQDVKLWELVRRKGVVCW